MLADLAPLSGLTSLMFLNFAYCNEITDLSPLAGLTTLVAIICRYDQV